MISDKRIETIDSLIASSLSEESVKNPPRVRETFTPLYFEALRRCSQTGIGAVTARVFAVKASIPHAYEYCGSQTENRDLQANFNRLLDVARETFKENVTDIYHLGRELSETHGLPLALVYRDSGFVFQLKKSEAEDDLPAEFINITQKKGRVMFSTLDLVSPFSKIRTFVLEFTFIVHSCRKNEMRG